MRPSRPRGPRHAPPSEHSRRHGAAHLLELLRSRSDVEYAEPNYIVHADAVPNDQLFWTPTTANPNYRIFVWARSAGNVNDTWEAYKSVVFPIQ